MNVMDISWGAVKEVFFAVGSAAGVLALLRPVIESKHQCDLKRAERILGLIPEQLVIDREPSNKWGSAGDSNRNSTDAEAICNR
jgi:hypothetical protein